MTALDYGLRSYQLFHYNHLLDYKPDKAWLNKQCWSITNSRVLFLAYFAMQVIYARRKYNISPPETRGHPEFERIFRAQ